LRLPNKLSGAFFACLGVLFAPPLTAKEPQPVHIMTSLPLFWAEGSVGDILVGTSKPPPLIDALRSRYKVKPVDFLDPEQLSATQTLILAQPLALRPEELVALDDWVQKGGRVMIFADPHLAWPSILPLGDPRRPPQRSLLSPLFSHWGISLGENGEASPGHNAQLWGHEVKVQHPGKLVATSKQCTASGNGLALSCQIGVGRALIVADADLLNLDAFPADKDSNLAAILAGLANLMGETPNT
jgi:hypothetical protein